MTGNECRRCGRHVACPHCDGPEQKYRARMVDVYDLLLLAHAGTPRECGIDTDTWEDAAMLEAGR